jgi:hypothetical protein
MSTTTSAELSLINDTEFLDELEQSVQAGRQVPDPSLDQPTAYDEGYDSLERGLPMDPGAPAIAARHYDREPPTADPYNEPAQPVRAERDVPFMAATLVIVACLGAGAATAAFVFHDRVTQITATRPASR